MGRWGRLELKEMAEDIAIQLEGLAEQYRQLAKEFGEVEDVFNGSGDKLSRLYELSQRAHDLWKELREKVVLHAYKIYDRAFDEWDTACWLNDG